MLDYSEEPFKGQTSKWKLWNECVMWRKWVGHRRQYGSSFCTIFRLFKYEEVDIYASEVWDSDTT
jgi:hypothetical protein